MIKLFLSRDEPLAVRGGKMAKMLDAGRSKSMLVGWALYLVLGVAALPL